MNKDYDWSKNLGTWMEWTKTLREDNVKYLLDTIIDDNKLQILESLLKYPAKEPLIQLIVKDSVLTEDDIIYLRGIKELRKENYEKSYNHFKRISNSYFKDTNSFYTTKKGISLIQNKTVYFSRSNSELDPKIKTEEYGILKFSEMMFNLQKEKENLEKQKSPKLINNYFTFGLIYQSMSDESGFPEISIKKKLSWGFDGWNWKYIESRNPITLTFPLYIPGITDSMNKSEKDIYFETQNFIKAENYYKKVIDLNTDKELSAKCCILINTARNNYLYFADEENGIDSINFKTLDKQRFEYFYTLNKQYKDTQFYKDFIKECPLIEKFQ